MRNPITTFLKGALSLHPFWRGWLLVLMGANLVVPLIFRDYLEARVIFGVFMVVAPLMMGFTAKFGFTRILGVPHFLWFGLLPWLVLRLEEVPLDSDFGPWLRAVIAIDAVSLVFDVADVIRYARGDRSDPTLDDGAAPEAA